MNSTARYAPVMTACVLRAEPVDHRDAADHAEQERRVQDRELVEVRPQPVGQQHDDREDQRRRPDDRRADQHRLGRRLERVAGAVVLLEHRLGVLEVGVDVVVPADDFAHVGLRLDQRQFVHALRVVGHRAVAVDGDRDRAHAEEAERDQAEREDRRRLREHDRGEVRARVAGGGDAVGDRHQAADRHAAHPKAGEVARRKAGQHVERRAPSLLAVTTSRVAAVGGGENLRHLRDDRAGERAAGDDRRQLPPELGVGSAVDADVADERVRRDVRGDDRRDRGDPHERGEGRSKFIVRAVRYLPRATPSEMK